MLREGFFYYLSIVILLFITCMSCSHNSDKVLLKKLTLENTLTRLKNGDTQFYYANYKDSIGRDLSDDLRDKLNSGKLKRDFYVNEVDSIKEIRVSILNDNEIFEEIQLRSAMIFPMKNFTFEDVNCLEIKERINKSINNDQGAREIDGYIKKAIEIDEENRTLVISIIEKCGWSIIDTAQINDVFLLVQHMDSEFMARYYPIFIEYHNKGLLSNLIIQND
ncbi:MAG: hypothetical protein IPN89_12935 [Saprospiraceae bacterium]|nr:hypothetical protein [Saprospiraceae bacterium]